MQGIARELPAMRVMSDAWPNSRIKFSKAAQLAASRSGARPTKPGKHNGRARIQGAGPHFAHSVTIFLSGINRIVGPQSVQSGQVVRL